MLQASVCYRIILAHTAEPCQFIRIIEANLVQNGPLGDNFHNIKCDWSACSWCVGGCQLEVTDIIYIFGEDRVAVSLQSFCMGYLPFGGNIKTPYAVKTFSNASLIQCFNQCNKLFMEMFFQDLMELKY